MCEEKQNIFSRTEGCDKREADRMNRENMTASELFRDNFATVDGFMSFFRYKTVRELASECGLETKDVSKVIKKMLKDGDAIKRGRAYKYPNGR